MRSHLSKYFEVTPPTGTPAKLMFKKDSANPPHAHFWKKEKEKKKTDVTKDKLEYQWPLWETFEISKLNFLKTELDHNSSKPFRTEWYACFDWYLKTSHHYLKLKIASLQNKILRLTEANKQLKKDEMVPKASGSSSLVSPALSFSSLDLLGRTLPLAPSSSHLSVPLTPPLYPIVIMLSNLPFFLKLFPPHFPLKYSELFL